MNIFDEYLYKIKKILLDLSKKGILILPDNLDGITAEVPPSKFNSDISTNVAMVLSKINQKSPTDLASTLAEAIKKNDKLIKDITIIKPGFINIKFKPVFWTNFVEEIIKNAKTFGKNKNEEKKNVLHIFNSKFYLDNKKVENLPIGLFGDFYSHELSFILIKKNDHKNLKSIFDQCNLKINKVLVKSFVKGVNISDSNENRDTFFQVTINKNNSKIFYFENNSLKLEQNFKFGTDIIIKDISKIISLKKDIVENILGKIKLTSDISENDLIEKSFFYS